LTSYLLPFQAFILAWFRAYWNRLDRDPFFHLIFLMRQRRIIPDVVVPPRRHRNSLSPISRSLQIKVAFRLYPLPSLLFLDLTRSVSLSRFLSDFEYVFFFSATYSFRSLYGSTSFSRVVLDRHNLKSFLSSFGYVASLRKILE